MVNGLADWQNKLNQNKLFQQEFYAKQRAERDFASALIRRPGPNYHARPGLSPFCPGNCELDATVEPRATQQQARFRNRRNPGLVLDEGHGRSSGRTGVPRDSTL